jgi:hypothetical protein
VPPAKLHIDDLAVGAALAAVLPPGVPAALASPFGPRPEPEPAAEPHDHAPPPHDDAASGASSQAPAPLARTTTPPPRPPTLLELDDVPRNRPRPSSVAWEMAIGEDTPGTAGGPREADAQTVLEGERVAASPPRRPFGVRVVARFFDGVDDVRIRNPTLFWGPLAMVAVAMLIALLPGSPPPKATERLDEGESWTTPWGVEFRFADAFDATIGGIPVVGLTLVAARDGEMQSFRISGFEAERERDAFGVRFRVVTVESRGRWIKIEARRPSESE